MTHCCPVEHCSVPVPRGVYMCARHWRMVPRPLQAAVYDSYRRTPGISDNHREALRIVNATEASRGALGLPAGMYALTVWQPWATLIIAGAKPFEFRRWAFTDRPALRRLVGQEIVVHAGARKPKPGELLDVLDRIQEGESALDATIATPIVQDTLAAVETKRPLPIPLGAAIGTVTLGAPRSVIDLFADKVADSDRLDQHMYGWPVSNPKPFPQPVPAVGAQGFWRYS